MRKSILNYQKILSSALLFIILFAVNSHATDQNDRKTDYQADQVLKSSAKINPSTLALDFSIPISGYAGRGGSGMPVSFSYSSKVWQIFSLPDSSWEHPAWGFVNDVKPLYAERSAAGDRKSVV